jgi:hypothetical protein
VNLPGLPPATFPADPLEPDPARAPDEIIVADTAGKGRLSMQEIATIGHLTTLGKSIGEIADIIDRNPQTVRANLRHARDILKVVAPEAVELWLQAARVSAAFGKHQAARDLVYAAGAAVQAAPVANGGQPSMVVQIGIALPGLPVPQPLQARTDDEPDSD